MATRATMAVTHLEAVVAQMEQNGGRIERHLISRLMKVAERAQQLAEELPRGPIQPQAGPMHPPPSPYNASQVQPGKQLTDVENRRLRDKLRRADHALSSTRAERTHLQAILGSAHATTDGSAPSWRWWHETSPNAGFESAPNDQIVDARTFEGAELEPLALLTMRAEKRATPVANGDYRGRTYARHEQAMAWSHAGGATAGGAPSVDVSIQNALNAPGRWFHLADDLSAFAEDGRLLDAVEQALTSGVGEALNDRTALREGTVLREGSDVYGWSGTVPVSVIEIADKPPAPMVVEVAVPLARDVIKEVEKVERVAMEVAVPVVHERIKQVVTTKEVRHTHPNLSSDPRGTHPTSNRHPTVTQPSPTVTLSARATPRSSPP
jgi:hypothetical protein